MRTLRHLFLAILMTAPIFAQGARADWQTYRNAEFRYSVQYPEHLFEESEAAPEQGGVTLSSPDGLAHLFIFGGPNHKAETSQQLARGLATLPDVYRVTYRRVSARWFVLSGYLADTGDIFYERVQLGPSSRYLSGFRLEYPASQRDKFDHLIGHMGRSLTSPAVNRP